MKNRKIFSILLCTAVMLTGCYEQDDPSDNGGTDNGSNNDNTFVIQANVENGNEYNSQIDYVTAIFDVNSVVERTWASADYVNGGFTIELIPIRWEIRREQPFFAGKELPSGVIISDTDLKISGFLSYFYANKKYINITEEVGFIYWGNNASYDSCSIVARFIYADRDAGVTGFFPDIEELTWGQYYGLGSGTYNLQLKEGWNIYYEKRTRSALQDDVNIEFTTTLPSGLKWYFEDYNKMAISETELEFPANAGSKTVNISSYKGWTTGVSDGDDWVTINPVAGNNKNEVTVTVAANGFETERIATVTFTNQTDSKTLKITQKGRVIPEGGVFINGVVWAICNVDVPGTFTASPESKGMLYQWNSNVGWSTTNPLINSNGETIWSRKSLSESTTTWEKANDPSPAGWRVPTVEEFQSLLDTKNVTHTNGTFTDKITGNSVYFPYVESRNNDGSINYYAGSSYWSSRRFRYSSDDDRFYSFSISDYRFIAWKTHVIALPVRSVAE